MKVFPRFSLNHRATFALRAVKVSRWFLGNSKKRPREQTNRFTLIYSVKGLMPHCHFIFVSYYQSCLFRSSLVKSCEHTVVIMRLWEIISLGSDVVWFNSGNGHILLEKHTLIVVLNLCLGTGTILSIILLFISTLIGSFLLNESG